MLQQSTNEVTHCARVLTGLCGVDSRRVPPDLSPEFLPPDTTSKSVAKPMSPSLSSPRFALRRVRTGRRVVGRREARLDLPARLEGVRRSLCPLGSEIARPGTSTGRRGLHINRWVRSASMEQVSAFARRARFAGPVYSSERYDKTQEFPTMRSLGSPSASPPGGPAEPDSSDCGGCLRTATVPGSRGLLHAEEYGIAGAWSVWSRSTTAARVLPDRDANPNHLTDGSRKWSFR